MKIKALIKGLYEEDVCIFCDICRHNLLFEDNGKGICYDCFSKLPFTPMESSFEGSEYVKYIIAPLFYTGAAKEAIKRFKFKSEYAYGDVLGKIMREYVGAYPHLKEFDAVTAVPLSKQRLNERGYNQSEILAKYVCQGTGLEYCDCVERIRNTKRQSGLRGSERTKNVKNAFSADSKTVRGKRIILVDDICTTGNTLNACAGAMINAGAKEIVGISCAYTYHEYNYDNPPRIKGKKSLWKEFLRKA